MLLYISIWLIAGFIGAIWLFLDTGGKHDEYLDNMDLLFIFSLTLLGVFVLIVVASIVVGRFIRVILEKLFPYGIMIKNPFYKEQKGSTTPPGV